MSSEELIEKDGSVVISDEVVSVVSAIAAKSVEGVRGMQSSLTGGFVEFLGKKNPAKGVKVSVDGGNVDIELSICVDYGVKIQDVAWEIQGKVKSEVEAMTGFNVKSVNVHVDGVMVPKEEKEVKNKGKE